MSKEYFVYLLTNQYKNVLYAGITNNLKRRVYEHKNKILKGFTEKYNVKFLIYYESCEDVVSAILREKQIKRWSRKKKNRLIDRINPLWEDLYDSL